VKNGTPALSSQTAQPSTKESFMGSPVTQARFDADAYLVWDAEQAEKSEYVAGEVFAMVGVRRVHATVAGNVFAALREHLGGSPWLPFVSDMKLRVLAADAFFYPDVMVTCDPRDSRL
jgi:Uma2 family endonuclease